MKVLLVGNLAEDRQESMRRFTDLLCDGLRQRGHDALQCAPRMKIARLAGRYRYAGLPKYFGYADKFLLFPRQLRARVAQWQPDVVHITDHANAVYLPATRRAPTLVTCHDLLQIRAARGEIPQQPVSGVGRRYQRWILRELSMAPHIACVSTKTRTDTLRLTGLPPERVTVVPNCLNYPFARVERSRALGRVHALASANGIDGTQLGTDPGFVLHVGAAHWYKNRRGLLSIYAELRQRLPSAPPLVLIGAPMSAEDEAQANDLGIDGHLISFTAVTSEELEAFYSLAEALIFPSWEEGFGWPIAEAQACGCPVFASDRAPMTEVGGKSAVYFDPQNPAEAARIIGEAWSGRESQRTTGFHEAFRWNPDTMFAGYEKIYRVLANLER